MENLTLVERVTRLAEPLLASLNLALWGIEYYPGTRAVLRLYIERAAAFDAPASEPGSDPLAASPDALGENPADVGIAECSRASRLIGLSLEVEDFIPSAYVLEVSTPGLERRFFQPAQLAAARGKDVEITLFEATRPDGRKRYSGRLAAAAQAENGSWSFGLDLPDLADLPDLHDPSTGEESRLSFDWGNVKKARQIYVEPPKVKPVAKSGSKKGAKSNTGPGKKAKAK